MTVDLSTRYLGLELANPLVASSSPLTGELDSLQALEAAGVAAVVLPSLFEEQIEQEAIDLQALAERGADSFAEALTGYLPEIVHRSAPEMYLDHVASAVELLNIPVIASLNGTTRGGWVRYARRIEAAGASGIELNIFLIPTDGYATGRDVEKRYLDLVSAVREVVDIPIAVKVGPYFSSLANMAGRLVDAGADGLVLFNRFYQPDIDLEALQVTPNLQLSSPHELRLPLRWVGILSGQIHADLAVTSGVHSAADAIKAFLAGATVAMMASTLLRNGTAHAATVLAEMSAWLEAEDYVSVDQMRGSMGLAKAANPDGFIRANYMKMLASYAGDES
jgi:dihydroorotate dehydrogenase (fumarate)